MKIGITTFGCDAGKSGISRYVVQLLREFARTPGDAQFEVLLSAAEESVFRVESPHFSWLPLSPRLSSPQVSLLWHQVALPFWCRKRGFDALFVPAANRRGSLWLPCPSVGTVHDFSAIHVSGKYGPARTFYIRQVLPLLVRRLTHVLTVSASSRRDIVEYARVPEARITVTPLGVESTLYHPGDRAAAVRRVQEKYGIAAPFVLYISRLEHPGKNHVRLIHAFARLRAGGGVPHTLVLAGSDWDRAEEVHRAAAECSCPEAIRFTGFMAGADLPDLYRAAAVFAFPSLYEGFGLPVLEAMASGVPVACSNTSSMPEVAGDAAVLFDPRDEAAIEAALRSLVLDEAVARSCAERGLQRSRQFTWAETAQRTLGVLRDVAARRPVGPDPETSP
jgi:glycosyltransferase involved in cell wall biosynthesis